MIQIDDKKQCCGCTACESICPKKAIKMLPDNEGFLYPHVDKTLCVECGLCEKTCPIIAPIKHNSIPEARIVRNNNSDIVFDSTSGGAFSAIAVSLMQEKKAIIFGACYDEKLQVIHRGIDNESDLRIFRGSKFVQSSISGCFEEIKQLLKSGQVVLFSGTPCQVAGLQKYLNNIDTTRLYLVDIVCRGVPSPKLWELYVAYMEQKYKSKIKNVKFRNKTYGYKSSTMMVEFENGRVYKKSGRIDPMMRLFTREMCSRPSCSDCAFKGRSRISDLTLFDCKKYTKVTKLYDDDRGYTAVLVHSTKGKELLELASKQADIQEADIDLLIKYCGIMVENKAQPNVRREEFFKELGHTPLPELLQRVTPVSKKDHMIEISKSFLYRIGVIKIARRIKRHEEIKTKR